MEGSAFTHLATTPEISDPSGGILDVIGNTPVVQLQKVLPDAPFRIYAKLEMLNPGGSGKDRAAFRMIADAVRRGKIRQSTTIIESSSGNLAIGLAQTCAFLGLRFIAVIDRRTTAQNMQILRAYGAEVDVVPDSESVSSLEARLNRVSELCKSIENSYWPNQYSNISNAMAHYLTTMAELDRAFKGDIDYLFVSCSTCGSLHGCSDYIRSHGLRTKIVAVDAVGSAIFGGPVGPRLIPGHGAAIVPGLFRIGLCDHHTYVSDSDCVVGCRRLVMSEAVLAGGSSGAVMTAVKKMSTTLPANSTCVAIFADRGERYLDSVYNDEWVESHFGNIAHRWQDDEWACK